MASIVIYSDGLRRIEFSLTPNGPRNALRLGRVSAKVAGAWKAKVESIIADRGVHRPHDLRNHVMAGGAAREVARLAAGGAARKPQQSAPLVDGRQRTAPGPECENARGNTANVECGPPCASAIGHGGWAARDSNP